MKRVLAFVAVLALVVAFTLPAVTASAAYHKKAKDQAREMANPCKAKDQAKDMMNPCKAKDQAKDMMNPCKAKAKAKDMMKKQ